MDEDKAANKQLLSTGSPPEHVIGGRPFCNDRNDGNESSCIKKFFFEHPHSTPKHCCNALGLDHKIFGGRARKIKHDLSQWRRTIVTDEQGKHLKHHIDYGFKGPVPDGILLLLQEKACTGTRGDGWHQSSNRNGQIDYVNSHVRIRVHRNGTCRVFPKVRMQFDDLRICVDDAFCNSLPIRCIQSVPFNEFITGFQVMGQHRTFPVGLITPFKNNFYKESLGLSILADGSHPKHLEVKERWPSWIPVFFEFQRNQRLIAEGHTKVISEFAKQIQSHLHAIDGIGVAADRLNAAVQTLNHALDRILEPRGRAQDSDNQSGIVRE